MRYGEDANEKAEEVSDVDALEVLNTYIAMGMNGKQIAEQLKIPYWKFKDLMRARLGMPWTKYNQLIKFEFRKGKEWRKRQILGLLADQK